MRTLWTAALCGLMLHAPALAQDGGQTADPNVAAENLQAEESVATDQIPQDLETIPGKPGTFAVPPSATVGPVAGYTYFHRTGATLADQRADLDACRPTILAMTYLHQPQQGGAGGGVGYYDPQVFINQGYSPSAVAGAGIVLALGAAAAMSAEQRAQELRSMQLNYENCMLVRGWNVMVLDQETGRSLDRASSSRLAQRLEDMVGASAPLGTLGRTFDNAHQFRALQDIDEISLSLQVLPSSYLAREVRRGSNMLNATNRREERERALRARERAAREAERERAVRVAFGGNVESAVVGVDTGVPADMPEGSALVLIESDGPTPRIVRLNAVDGDGADHISLRRLNSLSAFIVPAGAWRLVSLATDAPATSHCLGAPVFQVAPGEVVFAGAFDADGGVDLGLDEVRAALASQPHLAERLEVAPWVNGSVFECGEASFATAYEIADAPFVEGYTFGSRAPARGAP